MSLQKPINVYVCQKCRQGVVTIDRDEGATPFLIRCVSSKGCDGMAQSELYSVPQDLVPTYEWRKPTSTEYKKLDKVTRKDHVDRGGLLLYRIALEKRIAEIVERSLMADAAGNLPAPQIKSPKLTASTRRERRRQNSRDLIAMFGRKN